jgi:alkylhydroperoxidase family enzyme
MARIAPAKTSKPTAADQPDPALRVLAEAGSIFAHRPEIFAPIAGIVEGMNRSGTLSTRLKELIRLRIGFHNQCRTCMSVRYTPDLVDEALVCELERPMEAPNLTEAERLALQFADLFATDHLAIDDATYDALRAHFSEGELVELGIWCAYCLAFGRLMATWHVVDDLPQAYQESADGSPITPWGAGGFLDGSAGHMFESTETVGAA